MASVGVPVEALGMSQTVTNGVGQLLFLAAFGPKNKLRGDESKLDLLE